MENSCKKINICGSRSARLIESINSPSKIPSIFNGFGSCLLARLTSQAQTWTIVMNANRGLDDTEKEKRSMIKLISSAACSLKFRSDSRDC